MLTCFVARAFAELSVSLQEQQLVIILTRAQGTLVTFPLGVTSLGFTVSQPFFTALLGPASSGLVVNSLKSEVFHCLDGALS